MDQREGANNDLHDANDMARSNSHTNKPDSANTHWSISTAGQRVPSINTYTGRQTSNEIPKMYKLITIQLQLKLLQKNDLEMAQDLLVMYATLV